MANREVLLETSERRPDLCDDCLSRSAGSSRANKSTLYAVCWKPREC